MFLTEIFLLDAELCIAKFARQVQFLDGYVKFGTGFSWGKSAIAIYCELAASCRGSQSLPKLKHRRIGFVALTLLATSGCREDARIIRDNAQEEAVRQLERCGAMKAEIAGESAATRAIRRGDFRIGAKIHVLQESVLAVVPMPSGEEIQDAHWNSSWVEGHRFASDSTHRFPLTELGELIPTSDPLATQSPKWHQAARSCEAAQMRYVSSYNRTIFSHGAEVLDEAGRPSWQQPWKP